MNLIGRPAEPKRTTAISQHIPVGQYAYYVQRSIFMLEVDKNEEPKVEEIKLEIDGQIYSSVEELKEAVRQSPDVSELLVIDPDQREVLTPLTATEGEYLEQSLKEEGLLDDITVEILNGKIVVVDGMNRVGNCRKLGLPIPGAKIRFVSHENPGQRIKWMILRQLGRRNLRLWQRCELGLQLESLFSIEGHHNRMADQGRSNFDQPWRTIEEVANQVGVSYPSYIHYRKLKKEWPISIRAIKSGEKSISEVYAAKFGKEKPIKRSKPKVDSPDKVNGAAKPLLPPPPVPASKIGEQNSLKAPQPPKGNTDLKIDVPELSKEAAVKLAKAISGKTETPKPIPDWTLLDDSKALLAYIRDHSNIGSTIPVVTDYEKRQLSFLAFRDVVAIEGDFIVCDADQIPLEAEKLIEKCKKS